MDATANHIKEITVAAIDLGSNSFRLLITRISDRKIFPLSKRLVTVRLGQGLCSADQLSQEAMERGLAALEEFREEMVRYSLYQCRCCGTEALRKASNAGAFLARAAAIIDTEIEILSGEQEALLSCKGALQAITGAPPHPLVVVDVGGSSTEISYLAAPASPLQTTSIHAGAVAFKELSGKSPIGQAKELLADELKAFADKAEISPGQSTIIATGGTATSLASLDLGLTAYDEQKIHGHRLSNKYLDLLSEELGAMTDNELNRLPGMEPGRGNILPTGIEIYQEIIATIAVDGMIVSDAGLLEGIALSCNNPA